MTSLDVVAASLKNMDDTVLIDRWKRQLFSDEAIPLARAEFDRRGIDIPGSNSTAAPVPARVTSKYIMLRIIRGFFGFLAAWQILGLLPVLGWLSNLNATNGGLWAFVLLKVLALFIFGGIFFWLRTLINKLHTRKHGAPQPAMYTQWTL